jgi:4-hydroxy-tetrahydrodipicolinate synthase
MSDRAPSTYVISITPFDAEGRLDEEGLRGHFRRLAEARIGVYAAGGGSGEAYTLSREEIRRVLEIARDELKGRVPLRAMGVEPRTALEMIELGKVVQEVGLEAMQVYSLDAGHGNRPSDRELEQYFVDVLSAIRPQAIISTHQSVGYLVPLPILKRLVDRFDNVVGINCTSPDLGYLVRLLDLVGAKVEVHVGGPMWGLTNLALGGTGFLTSEGNLAPKLCVSVIDHYAAGRYAEAHTEFARLLHLFTGLSELGGIRATKAALRLLGLPGGYNRRPRLPFEPEREPELTRLLDTLDIRRVEGFRQT